MQFCKKIGIALGAGAARGLAHIGVLQAIEEEGIKIDFVAGTSMGAIVGAYFAKNGTVKGLKELALLMDRLNLIRLADPNILLMFKGFISGKRVEDFLKIIVGDIYFEDLQIPFAVVATDLYTGKEVVIKEGRVISAIRASISIPAIFVPVKWEETFLVDGALSNPVPVDIVRKMGADIVIASNVIPAPSHDKALKSSDIKTKEIKSNANSEKMQREIKNLVQKDTTKFNLLENLIKKIKESKALEKLKEEMQVPNIFEVLIRSLEIMEYEIAKLCAEKADIVITPDLEGISALDFKNAGEIIKRGYEKAKFLLTILKRNYNK